MTFEQLHYFVEISKDMNFTKTANRLYISQSTLSRQIAALENSLGTQLLIRDTRSVELTQAGTLLASEGDKLLKSKRALEEMIWHVGESLTGKISISTFSMQNNTVYQFCYRFQMKYPDVMLSLNQQVYGTTVQQLQENRADFCVGMSCEFDGAPPDIEYIPLWKGRYCVIVDDNHPLADKEFITPEDMAGVSVIMARKPAGSKMCIELHHQLGIDTDKKISPACPETLEDLILQVKAGLGAAILPDMLYHSNEGYKALPIRGVESEFNVVMAWSRNNVNPNMGKFKELLMDAVSNGFFSSGE